MLCFLKHSFCDSSFCLITDKISVIVLKWNIRIEPLQASLRYCKDFTKLAKPSLNRNSSIVHFCFKTSSSLRMFDLFRDDVFFLYTQKTENSSIL